MIFVIEGTDGSGKTTLANQLTCEITQNFPPGDLIRQIHRGKPKVDPLIEYTAALSEYQPNTGRHFILDRWHIGELVYGPLYRGKSGFTDTSFVAVDDFLYDRGALLIHCSADPDEIVRRLTDRDGQSELTTVEVIHHQQLFEQAVLRSKLNYVDRHEDSLPRWTPTMLVKKALELEEKAGA